MRVIDAAISLSSRSETTRIQTESVAVSFRSDRRAAAVDVSASGRERVKEAEVASDAAAPGRARPELERAGTERSRAADCRVRARRGQDDSELLGSKDDVELAVLRALLEKMTGRRMEVIDARDLELDPEVQAQMDEVAAAGAEAAAAAPPAPEWGLELVAERRVEQSESVSMQASGLVRSADGREIALATRVSYERHELSVERLELRAGAAAMKDPLVLVFDGAIASRTHETVALDLDRDGQDEQLPLISGNAAFLVHDRNGNGRVDDGSELLGAVSGDGFAELAALDQDDSGFIDDADAASEQLFVWEGRDGDSDRLTPLAARGVGALYTRAAPTAFELRGPDGDAWGKIRETGLFLKEDGGTGLLQQIDLKV
jgi:hypothetical protein